MSESADATESVSERERDFEKLGREIEVAAREQGGDRDENPRLDLVVRQAREANMPQDRIAAAIDRGLSGDSELEETSFEGYGPHGVAVFVEAVTDDRSRTAEELAELFEQHDGNLGEDGCVAWQFELRGLVRVAASSVDDEDMLMMAALDAGAEDVRQPLYERSDTEETPVYRVYCDHEDLRDVADALAESGYDVRSATRVREATQSVGLEADEARTFLNFYEKISRHPDVQSAYANWSSAS